MNWFSTEKEHVIRVKQKSGPPGRFNDDSFVNGAKDVSIKGNITDGRFEETLLMTIVQKLKDENLSLSPEMSYLSKKHPDIYRKAVQIVRNRKRSETETEPREYGDYYAETNGFTAVGRNVKSADTVFDSVISWGTYYEAIARR